MVKKNIFNILWGILFACTAACSSNNTDGAGDAGEQSEPVLENIFGEEKVEVSSSTGAASLTFNNTEIQISVQDVDTQTPAANIDVHGISLSEGVFIWTEDQLGRYFPTTAFVPFEETEQQLSSGAEPRIAATTILLGVVAAVNVGLAVHEYITDPPGIEEIRKGGKVVERCLTGDLNDALSAIALFNGVKTITGVIRVMGAPAAIRGVTAINLGFLKTELSGETYTLLLEQVIGITGVLDTDVQVYCWPVVNNSRALPMIDMTVQRVAAPFQITQIVSQEFYPTVPTRDDITTTRSIVWEGTPEFPVTLYSEAIACYPGWNCHDTETKYETVENPLVEVFGCYGPSPSTTSGFITYQLVLEDINGLKTPPATYTFRCGSPPDDLQSDSKESLRSTIRNSVGAGALAM